jgi:fido (protein-threonine AMPylation protein)
MRAPYLFDDIDVMRNLLGVRDAEELEQAEADITYSTLAEQLEIETVEFNIKIEEFKSQGCALFD